MEWFNYYGLIIMIGIMVPNIVYAVKKGEFPVYENKAWQTLEQIGRYGCMAFMVFNIPFVSFGYFFEQGQLVYLIVNGALLFVYILFWALCWKKQSLLRAYALSVLPSLIFLFSAVMLRNIPLLVAALCFAPAHVFISVKSVSM